MQDNLKNRAQKPEPRQEKKPEQPAVVDTTQRHVPPLICPICGRGMVPRVQRWELYGEAACICTLSGCKFTYRPAVIRVK
jgi:hypothetical protein